MGEKIDVKTLVKKRKKELKQQIDTLKIFGIKPKLAVILASDDEASRVYVGNKRKMCEEVGIEQEEYILDKNTTTEDIVKLIEKLNNGLEKYHMTSKYIKKNKKIRNSLFTELNKKFLTLSDMCLMSITR